MTHRSSDAGITLIEMLAALAVASLIGFAGFTLLDGVVTRDAQLSGRLDLIADRDRAFHVLRLDASNARRAKLSADAELTLAMGGHTIVWRADDRGLTRQIAWPDGRRLTQWILDDTTKLTARPGTGMAIKLVLPNAEIEKIIALPQELAP